MSDDIFYKSVGRLNKINISNLHGKAEAIIEESEYIRNNLEEWCNNGTSSEWERKLLIKLLLDNIEIDEEVCKALDVVAEERIKLFSE